MSDSSRVKILVVDDLPEKLLVYRVILEDLEAELVTAQSGAEALRQVLAGEFAVILLDVNMPDLDGFETARLIRTRKRSIHTPIIFVTAFVDELRLAEGYAHGAVDYIQAPVVPEILRAKIKVFIDLFRMNEQIKQQAEERIAFAEERSRREAVEEANRRLRFLARASTVIGQSLDHQVTSRDILRLTIPALADQAIIAQVEPVTGLWSIIEATAGEDDQLSLSDLQGLTSLPGRNADALERTLQTATPEFLTSDNADGDRIRSSFPSGAGGTRLRLCCSREKCRGRSLTPPMSRWRRRSLPGERSHSTMPGSIRISSTPTSKRTSSCRCWPMNCEIPWRIRNAVYVLRERQEQSPDVRWAQDVIDRQVTHMVRLVDDLLDVSRITRGKIRLEQNFGCGNRRAERHRDQPPLD